MRGHWGRQSWRRGNAEGKAEAASLGTGVRLFPSSLLEWRKVQGLLGTFFWACALVLESEKLGTQDQPLRFPELNNNDNDNNNGSNGSSTM